MRARVHWRRQDRRRRRQPGGDDFGARFRRGRRGPSGRNGSHRDRSRREALSLQGDRGRTSPANGAEPRGRALGRGGLVRAPSHDRRRAVWRTLLGLGASLGLVAACAQIVGITDTVVTDAGTDTGCGAMPEAGGGGTPPAWPDTGAAAGNPLGAPGVGGGDEGGRAPVGKEGVTAT